MKILDKQLVVIGVAAFLASLFAALLTWPAYGRTVAQFNPSNQGASGHDTEIISELGQLATLPTGETPKIYTITDPSQLPGDSFFKDVQAGDEYIIYVENQARFLYRPSTHRLINQERVGSQGLMPGS